MIDDLLPLLRCLACGASLAHDAQGLTCTNCSRHVPVAGGIPRFVTTPDSDTARRTQASFGYEWTHFNDWQASGETNFNDYFADVDLSTLRGRTVLDAGCGMGRHARQIAPHAARVVAVDFSRAIDQAARNVAAAGNVDCVQADLLALPLKDDAFDYVYSLGVLHHIEGTEQALKGLVAKLRRGGRLRIYLYWKHHGWRGALLSLATLARRLTTRMPFGLLRVCCWLLSAVLYCIVVLPYRALSRVGVQRHRTWPLFVYSKYPFTVLYNDQFDRFSAPLEKRYDPEDVEALLARAGLCDISIRPCYGWIGEGTKP
jgi:SAM-dependent methyltransferase